MGSNLGPETGYPDSGFSCVSPVSALKSRDRFLPHPLHPSFTFSQFIPDYIVYSTEKASLNELQIAYINETTRGPNLQTKAEVALSLPEEFFSVYRS
jgi:hypothetical protein